MPNVILTGGPGVGKTTLLNALGALGYVTVAESARAVIAERIAQGLSPRGSPSEFAQAVVRRDIAAFQVPRPSASWVFFDRGLVDGLGLLFEAQALSIEQVGATLARYPSHRTAFLLPPWREIYTTDAERDQSFADCERVHKSLVAWYHRCGYTLVEVPRMSAPSRASFVISALEAGDA